MNESVPKVLVLVGSESDLPVVDGATRALDRFGIGWELHVSSAHRAPERTADLARNARSRGFSVVIAGAGMAAHLPGVVASLTTLPVIGVPISSPNTGGLDALYAIVQMPKGIPVATVAIDGAWNAGLLAATIIAGAHRGIAEQLEEYRAELARGVEQTDGAKGRSSSGVPDRDLVPATT